MGERWGSDGLLVKLPAGMQLCVYAVDAFESMPYATQGCACIDALMRVHTVWSPPACAAAA